MFCHVGVGHSGVVGIGVVRLSGFCMILFSPPWILYGYGHCCHVWCFL